MYIFHFRTLFAHLLRMARIRVECCKWQVASEHSGDATLFGHTLDTRISISTD